MAEEDEAEAAGADAPGADGDEIGFIDWTCRLMSVERIESDLPDDSLELLFTVKFAVGEPDANVQNQPRNIAARRL